MGAAFRHWSLVLEIWSPLFANHLATAVGLPFWVWKERGDQSRKRGENGRLKHISSFSPFSNTGSGRRKRKSRSSGSAERLGWGGALVFHLRCLKVLGKHNPVRTAMSFLGQCFLVCFFFIYRPCLCICGFSTSVLTNPSFQIPQTGPSKHNQNCTETDQKRCFLAHRRPWKAFWGLGRLHALPQPSQHLDQAQLQSHSRWAWSSRAHLKIPNTHPYWHPSPPMKTTLPPLFLEFSLLKKIVGKISDHS